MKASPMLKKSEPVAATAAAAVDDSPDKATVGSESCDPTAVRASNLRLEGQAEHRRLSTATRLLDAEVEAHGELKAAYGKEAEAHAQTRATLDAEVIAHGETKAVLDAANQAIAAVNVTTTVSAADATMDQSEELATLRQRVRDLEGTLATSLLRMHEAERVALAEAVVLQVMITEDEKSNAATEMATGTEAEAVTNTEMAAGTEAETVTNTEMAAGAEAEA
eukprot:7181898-Prymnesium_polylepis.1